MNRPLLAAGLAAAPSSEQGGMPSTGAWAQIPPPAAGVFRVRPLPYEATASYLQRLAAAYRLTLPQLCEGAGIALNGQGTTPAAGLALSPAATGRIAVLSRIPMAHLTCALPHLTHHSALPNGAATARWTPFDAPDRPVAACTLCTRHHSQGTTRAAWTHRPWHRLLCPRHHQTAPDWRLGTPLRTGVVPELITAHHGHQRLHRHPRGTSAWMTARAITTRWYDHQQHLADRWHHRLHQLTALNAHLDHGGNASAALLARDLVIYPEAVILARTLATLPHQHRAHHQRETLTEIGRRHRPDPVLPHHQRPTPHLPHTITPLTSPSPEQLPCRGRSARLPYSAPFHR
ncbi:TniQ family protein [Streptomyces klenkii]|uniref:TniQ family protein n=1 Tax=Streptomyces klenkii TaxID=1420899 RepID=UPI001319C11B|nr:TniQ family protein [Streptomyces klenkii]